LKAIDHLFFLPNSFSIYRKYPIIKKHQIAHMGELYQQSKKKQALISSLYPFIYWQNGIIKFLFFESKLFVTIFL